LLEQGALYRLRVGLQSVAGERALVFAGVKAGAFSVYSGDAPYFHFDLDGRWQRAFVEGIHYLKGLDGSVQAIDRVREGEGMVLDRRVLSYAEASDLDAFIRSFIIDLTADVDTGRVQRVEPKTGKNVQPLGSDLLHDLFDRIAQWDAAAWFSQRERYLATYGPLPLIPPDCQGAVVLQATLGHADGRAFGLGTAGESYARSLPEFTQHCHDVARLLGRRAAESRAILVLGADLFRQPVAMIGSLFTVARQTFEESAQAREDRAIHAVLDDFSGKLPGAADWQRLRELGLSRVTLEVESGAIAVRAIYGRSWTDAELIETVQWLKAAGIGINLLTLVAAGGRRLGDEHLAGTSELISSLELGKGDLVFLLDEREVTNPELRPPNIEPLSAAEWSEQSDRLKAGLSSLKERRVKVLPYTLEKQRI
jgi:hypothetical protein